MTEIIPINPEQVDQVKLRKIGSVIKKGKGKTVVYPTDTLYGIGGNPWDIQVVEKILEIKRRNWEHGMPVLLSKWEYVENFGEMPRIGKKIAEAFWPGQVTIVIPKLPNVLDKLSGDNDSIALRIPNHPIALELIESAGGALIGTSANLHHQYTPATASGVLAQIGHAFDYLIDGGRCPRDMPSTIISVWNDGSIEVLREGVIPASEIFKIV